MAKKQFVLPIHIYHRIYRFAQRNIPPERIALTLDLPLKTVQRVLNRFAQSGDLNARFLSNDSKKEIKEESFLDMYIIPKVRYVVADFSGWITQQHCEKLKAELDNLSRSQWKVIALLMCDVLSVDEAGMDVMLGFFDKLTNRGRYAAILDPSPCLETFATQHQLEERIPIFGTEKTFEEEAFSTRRSNKPRPRLLH